MILYTDLLYGPNFLLLGTLATLTVSETFGSVDLTVIDKTDGVAADDPQGVGVQAIRPACVARMSEIGELGVDVEEIDGSVIVFNGGTWRIESHLSLPSPKGEADGQLMLYVIKAS